MIDSELALAAAIGLPVSWLHELADGIARGSANVFRVKTVRKRRGGVREVYYPRPALQTTSKNLYRALRDELAYMPPPHVHGFVRTRSTTTNALPHLGARCVVRMDLEDFFPSISAGRVEEILVASGFAADAAALCTRLVTIERKLPIGLSTSPFVSNVVFQGTDQKLAAYAASRDIVLTRYVDDLSMSGPVDDRTVDDITELLDADGWSVNRDKTRFMRAGHPQYVTGLYVGRPDKPYIPRASKKRMRWIMHMIATVGYETFMEEFGGEADGLYPNQLRGMACYYASIEPDLGYRLLRRMNDLVPDYYESPSGGDG